MKNIGIMGGTFDPIHYGHIVTAEEVRRGFHLDEVVFVPSGNPPHKKGRRITPAEHRLAMTELAVRGEEGFSVSDIEIRRGGYSYALDTVNAFREIYGEEAEIYFITGADAIVTIAQWYRADELMRRCRFIAAARPGYSFDDTNEVLAKYGDRVSLFSEPALSVSSSEIRARVAAGETIEDMLPPAVIDYIEAHGLYRKGDPKDR